MDFSRIERIDAAAIVETPAEKVVAPRRELIQAVKQISESKLFGDDKELNFTFDDETRRPLLRLVDRKTGEVVRQLPPEEVLRLAKQFDKKQHSQGTYFYF
jgi:flagellar protein FlaG